MKKWMILLLGCLSMHVHAEIVVGVTVSATGPGNSLGAPIANATKIFPKTMGGEPVRYIVLDDASDPTAGTKAARKLASEDKVDVLIGSSTMPSAIAQATVAGEERLPMIAISPIPINPAKQPFVFSVPQPTLLMVDALTEHMVVNHVKNLGFIGFSDSWGDLAYSSMKASADAAGIHITGNERYARPDVAVTGQILKLMAQNPDAVFVGGSGAPAALPQIAAAARGFKKTFYQTHGVVNRDFIRVGGKSVEGAIAPTGPVVVAEQLPADHPLKATGLAFIKRYEEEYGTGSRNAFAAYAWDAAAIIEAAVPTALKAAKPGTPAFRQALRDAIENTHEVKGTHAVYNMSATDHNGVDKRARVLVRVENGEWKLIR